jgi:tetratricopeptide (TPR) repeat protein
MARHNKKKGKAKHPPSVSTGDLVKQAEAKLEGGEIDAAARMLLRADAEVRQSAAASVAKGAALPPQIVEVRPRIARLLPRALFQRAFLAEDPRRMVEDLEEAVRRAPAEARGQVALGAARAVMGEAHAAQEHFRQAQQSAPEDALAGRGYALGLLATGHTREFGEWLEQHPEAQVDAAVKRLATLRDLIDGNLPLSLTPASGGSTAAPKRAKKGATGAAAAGRDGDGHEELAGRLLDSLVGLARGEGERPRKQLQARPRSGPEPGAAVAAVLATQRFYSGALRFQAGSPTEAFADFHMAQSLMGTSALRLPWVARLVPYYRAIAERALQAEDLALASLCWAAIREIDPRDAAAANLEAARRVRAYQAWRAERWEEAIPLLEESLRAAPEDEELLHALAIATEKAERAADAITHWRALGQRWRQRLKEPATDALFRERLTRLAQHVVDLMIQTGRPGYEIQNELDALVKLDPDNMSLRQTVATLLIEMDRPQPALKHIEVVERRQGESADLLALKGFALGFNQRMDAALRCFERALELDPTHATARMAYLPMLLLQGEAAEEDEDLEGAIAIYRRVLEIDPEYAGALSHLADALFELGQTAEAERMLERMLAIRPENAPRHIAAGTLYLRFGRPRKAESQFKRARELDPSEECLYAIGEAYLDAGNRTKTLQFFDRAIRAGNVHTTLAVSRALFDSEFSDDAEKYIDLALRQMPYHPEAHLARGIFLLEKGDTDEAEIEFGIAEDFAALLPGFEEIRDNAREFRSEIEARRETAELLGMLENLPRDMPIPRHLQRRLAELEKRR